MAAYDRQAEHTGPKTSHLELRRVLNEISPDLRTTTESSGGFNITLLKEDLTRFIEVLKAGLAHV